MGIRSTAKTHWKKLLIFAFLGGLLVGLPLALIPTGTLWGIDSREYGVRYQGTTYKQLHTDPDGYGISFDVLAGLPVVVSFQPEVLMEYGGIHHTDSNGISTPYDVPDREWESSGRKFSLHYYEVTTVVRTEAKAVTGWINWISQFTFVETDRVNVAPMLRVELKGEEGEDLQADFGNSYVVTSESIIYNPDLEGYTFGGTLDVPYHVSRPALQSKVTTLTELDTPEHKVYVMYKQCSLQAGAAYLYNAFGIVYGQPRICNVGVLQTWRFSFSLSRPVLADEEHRPEPVPDDDPAMPNQWLEKYLFLIIGIVVLIAVIIIIYTYVKGKSARSAVVVKVGKS